MHADEDLREDLEEDLCESFRMQKPAQHQLESDIRRT